MPLRLTCRRGVVTPCSFDSSIEHDADALDILAEIWREYPGLQRFARGPGERQ